MSTEADIVRRNKFTRNMMSNLDGELQQQIIHLQAEVAKHRVELDTAVREMRERCAKVADSYFQPGKLQHLGTKRGIAADIRALPDTDPLIATDGGTAS